MRSKLYLFGGFVKSWSHNQQLFEILKLNYNLIDLTHENKRKFGIFSFIKYFFNNYKTAKHIPNNSTCFIGFNSLYDVIVLRIVSFSLRKKLKIVNEALVMQYDTYITNKEISKNKIVFFCYKIFLYILDYLTLHLSDTVIFDSNANLKRFSKMYRLNPDKCQVIFLCANNSIFFNNKKTKDFWSSNTINILWYGNPSKLHNLEFIKNIFFELNKKDEFNCSILENMSATSLEDISELLKKTHISLGCFGHTDKCINTVINKEYEALASGTLLITKKGNKGFLKDCAILCETEQEVINKVNYFYKNRDSLAEYASKGQEAYLNHCNIDKLAKNYSKIIDSFL